MRKLNITDAFQLSRIIDKMELKLDFDNLIEEMQSMVKEQGIEKAQSFLGGQMSLTFISKLHKAEKEVIEWMASLTEKTSEEIKSLSFRELKNLIVGLFNSDEIAELFQSAEATEQQ